MTFLIYLDEIEVKIDEIKREVNNAVGCSRNAFSDKNLLDLRINELEKVSKNMDKLLSVTDEIKEVCFRIANETCRS